MKGMRSNASSSFKNKKNRGEKKNKVYVQYANRLNRPATLLPVTGSFSICLVPMSMIREPFSMSMRLLGLSPVVGTSGYTSSSSLCCCCCSAFTVEASPIIEQMTTNNITSTKEAAAEESTERIGFTIISSSFFFFLLSFSNRKRKVPSLLLSLLIDGHTHTRSGGVQS